MWILKLINYTNTLVILMLLVLSANIFAQERQKPPMPPDDNHIQKMIDDLTEKLSLTKDQQTEITTLFEEHFSGPRERNKPNREDMESNRKNFENKIMSILTEEQQEKYVEFMKNHRPERPRE